jgi:hypothetical protein
MEAHEYKVVDIKVEVSSSDLSQGNAGKKVAGLVELKLKEFARDGWEYYQLIPVEVKINKGCFGAIFNKDMPNSVDIYTLVFRRPVK